MHRHRRRSMPRTSIVHSSVSLVAGRVGCSFIKEAPSWITDCRHFLLYLIGDSKQTKLSFP